MKTIPLSVLAALALAACGPSTGTSSISGVCHGSNQSCSVAGDCCTGFVCENGTCVFVSGGNGGNATGGNAASGGASSGTSGIGGLTGGGSSSGGLTGGGSSSGGGLIGGSSTGGSGTGLSSASSSGTGTGSGTGGGIGSNGGTSSSGGGTAGSCPVLAAGEGQACAADGGTGQCPSPLVCAYDPSHLGGFCTYACTNSSDCLDIATSCVNGVCLWNPCGQSPDAGLGVNGTIDGPCNAAGVGDGTCLPAAALGTTAVPGLCLQTGGTSTSACNGLTRCADRGQICQTGWVCPSASAQGGPGTCEEVCAPSGPDSCAGGQVCADQGNGMGVCGASSVPDAGLPFLDGGLGGCGDATCGGCAAGQTCFCLQGPGGAAACVVGTGCTGGLGVCF